MSKAITKLAVGVVLVGLGVVGALAATGLAGDGLEETMTALGHPADGVGSASRKAS
jgi:hypothetical protein